MSTEFQKYRFTDFLKATALAPLACIPAVLLVGLPSFITPDRIVGGLLEDLDDFGTWALILILFSLPTAYISTAIFGALRFAIGNSRRIRLTIPIGAIAGVVCGVLTVLLLLWMSFLAGGSFDLSELFYGIGLVTLLCAVLSGLFVGVVYAQLFNRFVQKRSAR